MDKSSSGKSRKASVSERSAAPKNINFAGKQPVGAAADKKFIHGSSSEVPTKAASSSKSPQMAGSSSEVPTKAASSSEVPQIASRKKRT